MRIQHYNSELCLYLYTKQIRLQKIKRNKSSSLSVSLLCTVVLTQCSFPNLLMSLRTFLTMCVSVASCERSFSKLKLIKTYLRSPMGQERLSSLALLSIERGLTEAIDFHPCDRQVRDTQSKKDQAVMKELLY